MNPTTTISSSSSAFDVNMDEWRRTIRENRAAERAKRLAKEALATVTRRKHASEMLRLLMCAKEAVTALMALGAKAETEAEEENVFCLEWRAMDRTLEAIDHTSLIATREAMAEVRFALGCEDPHF